MIEEENQVVGESSFIMLSINLLISFNCHFLFWGRKLRPQVCFHFEVTNCDFKFHIYTFSSTYKWSRSNRYGLILYLLSFCTCDNHLYFTHRLLLHTYASLIDCHSPSATYVAVYNPGVSSRLAPKISWSDSSLTGDSIHVPQRNLAPLVVPS